MALLRLSSTSVASVTSLYTRACVSEGFHIDLLFLVVFLRFTYKLGIGFYQVQDRLDGSDTDRLKIMQQ